ncbi:helix-turn-helix domain-containing protein [Maribacter sp. 2210JD10-5]|uniref:helix-turn-helix domain-containing protein n=1 Tax=Maribacter sp. 2210JD10-5 TaxID=3386272 RepID=UPI0039BC9DBA
MEFQTQILFLFSALGAINGLVLSIYFAFLSKQNTISNYFLSALLMVLSIRIIKSVFFYFNSDLSQMFIQVGLSACMLIGPFLYLYITSATAETNHKNRWLFHVIPFLILGIIAWFFIPYREYRHLWAPYLVKLIYFQWFVYIFITGFYLKNTFKKFFSKKKKLNDVEVFHLSIYVGTTIIWIAYSTSRYTSYIIGALSFSFVFYLLMLLWFFKRNKNSIFFEKDIKYANKKIDEAEAKSIANNLEKLMIEKQLYSNPDLKLSDLAKELHILPHRLSQYLNDNVGKSFSQYLNEYRIKAVENMLLSNELLTLEAIGNECGFNSNSTFYAAFKKIKGITPAKYKKQMRS